MMKTLKTIAITLSVTFAVEVVIVGAYLSQAPKKYRCEKIED